MAWILLCELTVSVCETLIVLFFCMAAATGFGDTINARFSAFGVYYTYFSEVSTHELSDKGFSFAKLKSIIETNKLKSVDETLSYLKNSKDQTHLDFMKSFVLLRESESIQEPAVSHAFPRIILHKDRLFVGLAGDPSKKDFYEGIETIEYDGGVNKWVFRTMHFDTKGKLHVSNDDTRCKNCHGIENSRPNWNAYDLWPGAYFGTQAQTPGEARQWKDFLESVKTSSRYKHLIFGEATEFKPEVFTRFQNTHLHVHLSYANFSRVMKTVKAKIAYDKWKYAMMSAFVRCEPIEDFIPKEKRPALDYKSLYEDTAKVNVDEYDSRVQRFNMYNNLHWTSQDFEGKSAEKMNADVVAKLRYILEPQGVSMKYWAMSYNPGEISYSYNFGVAGSAYFTIYMLGRDFILYDIEKQHPDAKEVLRPIYEPAWDEFGPHKDKEAMCVWLKKKSVAALAK